MLRRTFLLVLILTLIPCISYSEIKTYTHTVKQAFGGSQSPDDARVAAIHKAKREALEKAGTYLESLTIVKDSMIEKDEILALAAGVLKAEIISQKNFANEDASGIIVVAKVGVDTSVLEDRVNKLLKDRELLKNYQESQKREKELLAKITLLEKKNRKLISSPASEGSQKKDELKKQFRETTQGLTAVEWFNNALGLFKNGSGQYTDPNQALDYFTKAISLESGASYLYYNRGIAYSNLGKFQQAIDDYSQVIRLDPKDAKVYNSRGNAYGDLGKYQQAIENFNQAISLDPKDAGAYNNRGIVYTKLGMVYKKPGKFQEAIEDLNQAIYLDPKNADVYHNRGVAYTR